MAARRKQRSAPAAGRPTATSRSEPASSSPASAPALLIAVALVCLNLFSFGQIGQHPYSLLDDPIYVSNNQHLTQGLTSASVKWAFATFDAANWHPITWLSHLLDAEIFGPDPGPQHLVSLAIHIVNALVLFFGLRRLTGALGPSALVAALFSVHPLNVESVAWIAERKNVLSTFFWWTTIAAYVHYVRGPSRARYVAVVLLFAIGLMAKPMLVTLPLGLLLLDVWPLERAAWPWRTPVAGDRKVAWPALLGEKIPLLILAAGSAVVTVVAQRSGGAVVELGTISLGERMANVPISYLRYLEKAVWPVKLIMFYPYPAAIEWTALSVAVIVLVAISVAAIRAADRRPFLLAGWLWYLVTLVPVVGLVQVGRQAMADRYAYVPLVGIFVAVAWGLRPLVNAWRGPSIVRVLPGVVVVALLAMASRVQAGYWVNTQRLLEHTIDVMPDHVTALHGLAGILSREGRHDEALAMFARAVAASPESAGLRAEMAEEYATRGVARGDASRFADAIQDFRDALKLAPGSPAIRVKLGLALLGDRRPGEAVSEFQAALDADPADAAGARFGLGLALAATGHIAEARAALERVVREHPDNDAARQALARIK